MFIQNENIINQFNNPNALHEAVADPLNGRNEIIQLMQEQRLDVDARHTLTGLVPIAYAAQTGSFDTFIYLIENLHAIISSTIIDSCWDRPTFLAYLLDPANPFCLYKFMEFSPIEQACIAGNYNLINKLLTINQELFTYNLDKYRTRTMLYLLYYHGHFAHANYYINSNPFQALTNKTQIKILQAAIAGLVARISKSNDEGTDNNELIMLEKTLVLFQKLIKKHTPSLCTSLAEEDLQLLETILDKLIVAYDNRLNCYKKKNDHDGMILILKRMEFCHRGYAEPDKNMIATINQEIELYLIKILLTKYGLTYQSKESPVDNLEPEEKGFFQAISMQAQKCGLQLTDVDKLRDGALAEIRKYSTCYYRNQTLATTFQNLIGLLITIDGADPVIHSAMANLLNVYIVILSAGKEPTIYAGRAPDQKILYLAYENGAYYSLQRDPTILHRFVINPAKSHTINLLKLDESKEEKSNKRKREEHSSAYYSNKRGVRQSFLDLYSATQDRDVGSLPTASASQQGDEDQSMLLSTPPRSQR